ncbi:MAG: alpha/beta hydrolase [Dehalococcoidia bacterium]|jgi:pimeloyl-ACP methyl ester carboxylesterase
MPDITRPDGATIHYEVFGSGYPLLLIAPGGVSSQIEFWRRSAVNPIERFANDFQVIAMDQRHAARSLAPMRPFSYDQCNADQLAVLDHLGIEKAHVMGGCIGCAHIWRLISNAPGRITAAVTQDPVGLEEPGKIEVFYRMFHETMRLARAEGVEAVVRSAVENPMFVMNNGAGPFAPLLAASEAARQELLDMGRERYIQLIVEFRDGIWPVNPPYFTVSEQWMREVHTPMLVLPGRDEFHPPETSARICRDAPNVTCLAPDCREPANLEATVEAIRAFLKAHTPA